MLIFLISIDTAFTMGPFWPLEALETAFGLQRVCNTGLMEGRVSLGAVFLALCATKELLNLLQNVINILGKIIFIMVDFGKIKKSETYQE